MTSTNIDDYLAGLDPAKRKTLESVRRMVRAAVPQATEVFAYGMPGFKYMGRPLVYYGAAKEHCGLYGILTDEFRKDLTGYDVSKGTIRFPISKPPPATLIKKLMRARVAAIEAKEGERKGRRKA